MSATFDITASAQKKEFVTSDGVRLSYLEAGEGTPFVMVPGNFFVTLL